MVNDITRVPQRGESKTGRIPIKIIPAPVFAKPDWIRARLSQNETFLTVEQILREQRLHTVCEEASCPNIGECFSKGTATFMILGDLCTGCCPFCDVAHGREPTTPTRSRCSWSSRRGARICSPNPG